MTIQIVILAAGKGKRMHSALPKVLHPLAGKALLAHVLEKAFALVPQTKPVVIYGHEGEKVQNTFAALNVDWVEQKEQKGTGHALQCAMHLIHADQVLVLYGDVPLISVETLQRLILETPKNSLGMVTANLGNPSGYGRVIRDSHHEIIKVVEDKDATPQQQHITEINSGIYLIPAEKLRNWLPQLVAHNAQKEYYLTDIVPLAVKEHVSIYAVQPKADFEIFGINDRLQLSALERIYQLTHAYAFMRDGVTIIDPARFDMRGNVSIDRDAVIDVNVILEGEVRIGEGTIIGPNCHIINSTLANNVVVKANSIIEGAFIESEAVIGPFARIRPHTQVGSGAHIGNFVEIKQTNIGKSSKINHLSYVGDAEIGDRVNIGAGTITCNYDGAHKHKTIIGDDVFIGSDTQLVAPVTVGNQATIGAGSTVTKDVEEKGLTLTHRLQQRIVSTWKRPLKEPTEA